MPKGRLQLELSHVIIGFKLFQNVFVFNVIFNLNYRLLHTDLCGFAQQWRSSFYPCLSVTDSSHGATTNTWSWISTKWNHLWWASNMNVAAQKLNISEIWFLTQIFSPAVTGLKVSNWPKCEIYSWHMALARKRNVMVKLTFDSLNLGEYLGEHLS